ncbi:MAG: PAS domain S-box protein [Deltaproteobacteria bacterium]|nr:PAS domain S-box protein [Deltaproteobacteria bacterium]
MLEETARLTRILLDALPGVALLLRPGSREIVAANEMAVKCGAIPGRHCYDTWGRREDPCPWCLAPTVWTSFKPQRLEVEALGIIWDAHWIPVTDDLYVHYAFDITSRKKADEGLRRSEKRFSTFFNASPVGIAFSRLKDKRILEVNDLWQKITGYDRLEAIGRTPTELNLWVDRDERDQLKEKVSEQGSARDLEVQIRQKSGNIINLLISVEQVELEGEQCLLSMSLDITERQQAEKALRESEVRFREIFENMTEGVAIYQAEEGGTDFVLKDINPAGARSGKIERHKIKDRSVQVVFPGIKEMGLLEVFQEVYRTGKPNWHPVSRYTDDRISLWAENYVFKLPSGEIVTVYDDLTERVKAEEKLRESEEKFRHLVEAASEGICRVDENFTITYVNRQMAEMLGYSPEEMVGRPIENFMFPEDLASHISKQADRRKGILERYERKFRHKEGTTLWTIVSPKPLIDENGKFRGSFATFTDITQRKTMEEILNDSEEKYRTLFEHTGAGLIIVEEDTTISLVNNEFLKLSGYLKEEIEGKKKSADFTLPEDLERIHLYHTLRRKNPEAAPREYESRIVDKQGNIKNTHNIVALIPGTSKSIVSFNDITNRKKAEEALLEKQNQLQALAIRMSEVEELERKEISRTLHDLVGQNLTALNLNLNIAISMLPEKTSSIIIHRLEDAQKLLEETTQHIREVMSDLRPSVLDDFGLLAALYWYGERFKALTGIEINIEGKDFPPRLSPTMESIIFRIAQEALTNVSKHAGADQVDIVLEERPGKVQLTISDNGWGFLFKGFRLGGEKRGWGLATMKERAAALGGDLAILSEPGKGTRIILQLPVER